MEFGGAQYMMKPGLEASLEEVHRIRSQLAAHADATLDRLSRPEGRRLDGPDPDLGDFGDLGLCEETVSAALAFLSSPRGDFLDNLEQREEHEEREAWAVPEGAAEEVGLGVLTLLGRADAGSRCGGRDTVARRGGYKAALSGRMVPARPLHALSTPSKPVKEEHQEHQEEEGKASKAAKAAKEEGREETSEPLEYPAPRERLSEERCLEDWATGLVQSALLQTLKRRAAAAEAFDVAGRLKARELGAAAATAAGRARALQLPEPAHNHKSSLYSHGLKPV